MAAEPIPIFTDQDFYVPTFQVKVGGKAQGQQVIRDILQVTYKDNIAELDTFDITINNWDAETRAFKYSDDDLFDPGKEVELWMGYMGKDSLRLMVRGEITGLHPSFPSGGGSTLAVSGLNLLHKLRRKKISHAYVDKTDAQIAQIIADRLGIELKVHPAQVQPKYGYVLQSNELDIMFLMHRARQAGYELYVEEDGADGHSNPPKLVFGVSEAVKQPTYELEYGRSLIEFKPELTTVDQVAEVTVRSWDPVNKVAIEETAKRSEIGIKGVGAAGNQDAIEESFKQRREIVATTPVNTKAEAKAMALQALTDNAKELVRATASTIGLPDLRAGSIVKIDGAGKRFSGRYFVTATTHTFGDSGYTTQFECRREEV
jgi:phage protein D